MFNTSEQVDLKLVYLYLSDNILLTIHVYAEFFACTQRLTKVFTWTDSKFACWTFSTTKRTGCYFRTFSSQWTDL